MNKPTVVPAPQSPQSPKQSMRKQVAGTFARIDELENGLTNLSVAVDRAFQRLQEQINQQLSRINQQLSQKIEIVDALVDLLGEDTVLNAIEVNRVNRTNEQTEAIRQRVVSYLETGKFVAEEIVRDATLGEDGKSPTSPGSYVAIQNLDSEGKEVLGGYICQPMATLKPEFKTPFIGKSVGFECSDNTKHPVEGKEPQEGKLVLVGIYELVTPKAPEAPVTAASAEPLPPTPAPATVGASTAAPVA